MGYKSGISSSLDRKTKLSVVLKNAGKIMIRVIKVYIG